MSQGKPRPAQKMRQKPPRLLKPNGGTVQDPHYALGMTAKHSTPSEYLVGGEDDAHAVPPEPEAIPREWEKAYSKLAKDHHGSRILMEAASDINRERGQLRGQLATYERVARERGLDIRSDVRVVERRLADLDRKLGLNAA